MRKRYWRASPWLILLALACGKGPAEQTPAAGAKAASKASASMRSHPSSIAGTWFPDNPTQLGRMLDGFLHKADPPSTATASQAVAFIVPHAGYTYSGQTAAFAYKIVAERKPRRVVVIGPSHRVPFRGLCVGDYDSYETPLGPAPIDREAVETLRQCPLVQKVRNAEEFEHSVDIQMPFLMRVLPADSFKVVPIIAGDVPKGDFGALTAALRRILTRDTILIASSDFTHYGVDFGYTPFPLDNETRSNLEKLDMGAVRAIETKRPEDFLEYRARTGITVCGYNPIALTLSALPADATPTLLKYAVSGDTEGDYSHSVSYVSLVFTSASGWGAEPSDATEAVLSADEKKTLLKVARDTLDLYVRERKKPDVYGGQYHVTPAMRTPCGAFVTLKERGQLRGCIGHIQGRLPMIETVQENAVNAAAHDYRFSEVQPDELPRIEIEISVLSPLRKVGSHDEIVIGRHGILLKQGGGQAVFLPQVAPEQGWDLDQTLSSLARKAGLPADAWKKPDAEFQVFTAQVFSESEPGL